MAGACAACGRSGETRRDRLWALEAGAVSKPYLLERSRAGFASLEMLCDIRTKLNAYESPKGLPMVTNVSQTGIEAMGFRQAAEGEDVIAQFHGVHVYEVRGFTLEPGDVVVSKGSIGRRHYQLGIGHSANGISIALVGEPLTEDEDKWAKENNCSPPYLLVQLGPTAEYTAPAPFIKRDGDTLITYDSFPEARAEIRAWKEDILPNLETAFSCTFATEDRTTRFVKVSTETFGITSDGNVVIDVRLEMKAAGYGAVRVGQDWVRTAIDLTNALAPTVNPKVSRVFHAGLHEQDPLKRFLYFFLTVEIETHGTFKSIDHGAQIEAVAGLPPHIRESSLRLLEGSTENWRGLVDRFTWCAVSKWRHIDDSDVKEMRRLKKIRDGIAHGAVLSPAREAVAAIEKLASKLQLERL